MINFFAMAASAWGAVLVLPWFVIVSVVVYIVLRWRESREQVHDPQMGVKFALNFLLSASVLVLVIGVSTVASEVATRMFVGSSSASPNPFGSSPFGPSGATRGASNSGLMTPGFRAGASMGIAGLVLSALYGYVLTSRTNHSLFPRCFRLFTGCRAIIAGAAFSAAFVAMFVFGFQPAGTMAKGQLFVTSMSLAAVWGVAAYLEFAVLQRFTRRADYPGGDDSCRNCGASLRGADAPVRCPNCNISLPIETRRSLAKLAEKPSQASASSQQPKPHPLDQ